MPRPVGTAEASLINSSYLWNADTQIFRGADGNLLDTPIRYGDYYAPPTYPQFVTGDAITLSGLFKWRKEAIDPVNDAQTGPGYFSAQCPLTVEVVLKGGNCPLTLGWYNVADPNSTTPPSATDIFPFVDDPGISLDCKEMDGVTPQTDGFCPLAWDNVGPLDVSKKRWTPKQFSTGDLKLNSHYTGGSVAFALLGVATSVCKQNKFSMYEHNLRNLEGVPWVTALFYASKAHPGSTYIAFEDTPMPSSSWTSSGADGDFNDIVYYVSGCSSDGGGSGDAGAGGASAGGASSAGGSSAGAGRPGEAGDGIAGAADTDGPGGAATSTGGDAGATNTAGNANAGDSASATGGVGGSAGPQSPDTKSSSCGCAVPGGRATPSALALFGLALGATFARRRRRATSSTEPRYPR